MALLTYQQAADYLEIPVGSLYRLVHDGRVAFVKEGKRGVRFMKRDLLEYQRERKASQQSRLRTQDSAGVKRLVAEARELLPDPPEKMSLWVLREVGLYRGTVRVMKGPGDSESDALRKLARLAWPERSFTFEKPKGAWKDKEVRRGHVAEVARQVLGRAPRTLTVDEAKLVAPKLSTPAAMVAGGRWKLLNEYDRSLPKARPLKEKRG